MRRALAVALLLSVGCAILGRERTDGDSSLGQLVDAKASIAKRDLFHGVGGAKLAPARGSSFQFVELDTSGMHSNYELVDEQGRRWDAKPGTEARPEVVASRLLWAIGFHQPPIYYLSEWTLVGGPEPGPKPGARFRLEQPSWKKDGDWAWHQNPFVGTHELDGLLVLMVLINNWDLKTSQNTIYDVAGGRPERVYVVKDLGQSLGGGLLIRKAGDIEDFESVGFIRGVDDEGRVSFGFDVQPIALGVLQGIEVEDVLWTCRRLEQLSDAQWRDAFRAGGYEGAEAERFIARMRAKVAEGLALAEGAKK